MSDNIRKCILCGSSPAKDANISLHRFPKPGKTNSLRCEMWAKYCFPHESWASLEFQLQLYSQHKMLCSKHFISTCFVNKKLFRTAVPTVGCDEAPTPVFVPVDPYLPVAGPSKSPTPRKPLSDKTNIVTVPNITQDELEAGSSGIAKSREPTTTQEELLSKTEENKENTCLNPQNVKELKLRSKLIKNMKKVWRLQRSIKKLKSESFINVISKDESVQKILKTKVSSTMALLLQGELQNFKKCPKARRWSTDAKITALRLYKRSPSCYKLLRRLVCLPAPGTLKSLLNQFNLHVGINEKIFNVLKKSVKHLQPSDKEFVLMFDEMAIKKNLSYNKKSDIIEGFQDHGYQGRSPQFASYALVFMVAGVRKHIKQPVAFYLSGGSVTADRLSVLIKEVLRACFDAGLSIAATVSDLDGVNKRAVTLLGASTEKPYFSFEDKEIVSIFDTPHLLKCFRNLFLKYDIKCQTDIKSDNQYGIGIAKWSYIKQFYELDNKNPFFVYAPALKQDHLNPNTKQKMKVKLAAQILSSSVSGGMYSKIAQGELPSDAVVTANVVKNIDTLFDAVNAASADLRRGKKMSTNITEKTEHLVFFGQMKNFFKNLTFIGCRSSPPSKDGWVWTLNGLERLWRNLRNKHKIKSLATRRIQQDPLENLFGCIRSNCGSNTNPTSGQFVAGLKTAILSNLTHISGTGNCEEDGNDVLLKNYKSLFSTNKTKQNVHVIEYNLSEDYISDLIDEDLIFDNEIENPSSELQACTYVCGFIVKNNKKNNECLLCKKILESDAVEEVHSFSQFKEYLENKNLLTYASKNLIIAVENCAILINAHLEKEAYKNNLKNSTCDILRNAVNWDFLNGCTEHKQHNLNYIIKSVFFICIKRFCIVRNRKFAEDSNMSALKKKINILTHK